MAIKNAKKNSSSAKKQVKSACESQGIDCKPLQIGETIYNTLYTKKFESRVSYKPVDPKKILSYIPGTILKIFVEEGKEMKAGDAILILEAMKMRNIVTIPFSGKLKKIFVKEGETIPKNFLIAEIQ
jgi:biotin carboxyl carrier protein